MFRVRIKPRSCSALIGSAAVGISVLTGTASPAYAEVNSLRGAWAVVTQERNCSTGAAIGPTTRALVTYHAQGTVSESRYIPVFALGQLSDGHGTWRRDGDNTFIGRVVTMVQFDSPPNTPPGVQAGWQIASQTISLQDKDSFTMSGSSEFVNLAGEVYRVGCATRVGQRFR
jgi:hypothetical protein